MREEEEGKEEREGERWSGSRLLLNLTEKSSLYTREELVRSSGEETEQTEETEEAVEGLETVESLSLSLSFSFTLSFSFSFSLSIIRTELTGEGEGVEFIEEAAVVSVSAVKLDSLELNRAASCLRLWIERSEPLSDDKKAREVAPEDIVLLEILACDWKSSHFFLSNFKCPSV